MLAQSGKLGVSETELARAGSQAGISSVKMLGKSGEDSERLKQCGRQAARIKRGDAKACPLQEALDANNGWKHGVRFRQAPRTAEGQQQWRTGMACAASKLLLERRSKRCKAAMMLVAGLGRRLAEGAQTRI
jgi:hypothetical protein